MQQLSHQFFNWWVSNFVVKIPSTFILKLINNFQILTVNTNPKLCIFLKQIFNRHNILSNK
ncbi:hypothetical protein A3224_04515 [Microbulbifer thermotolerans]|uniref:Uncharacterized protein n=1 Tax=Microbulbifer thermotolerans TaxID=252514 RepID=A0A143HJP4_MICTH|nr:hypothetical protein A3224_04515 [Microbulbifer thermotolerans]